MNNTVKLAAIGLAALSLAACSGTSSSIPAPTTGSMTQSVMNGSGHSIPGLDLSRVRIMPTVEGARLLRARPDAAQTLTYFGGLVLTPPHVYVVYWGFGTYGDTSGEQKYLTNFLNGVGGSTWESLLTQYYQIVGSTKTFVTNPTGQLLGTWVDNSSVPRHPSDAAVQAEANRLVAHFGYSVNDSYVVATPHRHNTSGFGTSYCAYHGAFNGSHGVVSYTNLGYMTDAGFSCGEGFVNSPGTIDGVSIVEGHEYAESVTDPNPPSGWYNNSYGEIGDICAWMKPPAGDITLSTGTFAVQGLWSNASSACKINGP